MKLVERKDPSYFKTFVKSNPDVNEAEIRLSESKSKFVRGFARRKTFTIENPSLSLKLARSESFRRWLLDQWAREWSREPCNRTVTTS